MAKWHVSVEGKRKYATTVVEAKTAEAAAERALRGNDGFVVTGVVPLTPTEQLRVPAEMSADDLDAAIIERATKITERDRHAPVMMEVRTSAPPELKGDELKAWRSEERATYRAVKVTPAGEIVNVPPYSETWEP